MLNVQRTLGANQTQQVPTLTPDTLSDVYSKVSLKDESCEEYW